ncbi:hypothetical protein BAUCODRAFT_118654 [Baudoinia panamericana UAMH 10762]|uniref:Vesicle-mediated transport protein Vid24 n=1 Tax=Baudoinia panamericana (strain UAMH 10762) TaxID=717646 RepID=M2MVD6_BAUPA|nr:uncharacterized protein BAUCODRAFT_118654 [Baudoinia panamericana UAMH 10762]EMD00932.1 hypothetical protein BAUCODRAFT_118654 [Baudoinia panamericana UAMH 10762]
MPTPSELDVLPSAPSPIEASSSRTGFASCPPEEERVPHAPRTERLATPESDAVESDSAEDEPMRVQGPTPHVDAETLPSEDVDGVEAHDKAEHIEDAGIEVDVSSSPESLDASTASDIKPARSTPITAKIPSDDEPLYLTFPNDRLRRTPNSTSSLLRPGSRFRGTQQSDRQVYDVQVEIKDVDMAESFLCGYLRIQGLTDDHPTLTTFFEGEIVGPKYLFKTTHPTWGSSEKVDLQHWARFPAWRPLAKSAKSPNFTLKNYQQREHLFMRWKEYFLVPDHRVKTITGASFEGFYYICFNQCTGTVSGIYFHAKSEKYQQLELEHVDDKGCMGAIEFR